MQKRSYKLLETKIQIPDVQKDFLKREFLLDELAEYQEKLLVLHATIGYGKTVLMSQYVKRSRNFCAWYHLDPLDNEVSTFIQYLVQSLQRALGDFVFDVKQYLEAEEIQVLQMTRELVMELTEYISGMPEQKMYFVLDDFHVLENPEIFEILENLLKYTNDQIQFFIATKSAVPDFLIKYMMSGQGKIINSQNLSFQEHEVYDVLYHVLSKGEAESYAKMVWQNMEGWPAGVMFAALYLRQRGNRRQQVEWEHISHESLVHNYITYELFKGLPYELQSFLLKTSFAMELSPMLCNEICGITNSSGILKYLFQENMFILHVGDKKGCYRYHSIFREFLREQAGEQMGREVRKTLALYYMKHHEMQVAAKYALEAEEPELLLFIVEKEGILMFREGKRKLVEKYLHYLENIQPAWTPEVWYVAAVCAYWKGRIEEVRQNLNMACNADSAYAVFSVLYEGAMQIELGNEEAGEVLLRKACYHLIQKNKDLPLLSEKAMEFAEKIWKEEIDEKNKKAQKPVLVSCFGKFKVSIPQKKKEISWRTRKAMELFAYLADLEGKPVERRVLLEQLWPENPPNNAVAMLHNMIYSIRKELSDCNGLEELIQYKNRQYSLNMSLVESDLEKVKRFCTLAEQGKTEELWAEKEEVLHFWGIYLEEIDDSWCTARRAYFERSYGKVCRMLAADCEKREDFETAALFWRAYMEADRYSEEAIAGLIRVYGKLNERGQMKKIYESAKKLYREELGLELGEEVEKIYKESIKKGGK